MTIERYLWWIVLLAAFRHAWLAHRKADVLGAGARAVNEEGSMILARCVLRIRRMEPFLSNCDGLTASHGFTVGEDRFVVTVRRRGEQEKVDG